MVATYVSSIIIIQTCLLTLGVDVKQNMNGLMMEELITIEKLITMEEIITMVSFSC